MKNAARTGVAVVVCVALVCAMMQQVQGMPVQYPLSALRIAERVGTTSSCLPNNGTHCTCIEKQYNALVEETPGNCRVMPKKQGFACGCPGTSLCEVENFECERAVTSVPSMLLNAGELVGCSIDPNGACTKAEEANVCNKFVNVYIDGERQGCIETVPVESNVDDAYGYQDAKATSIDTVELDFMNVRLVRTMADEELHFCVIYGNWQVGEDTYNEKDKNVFNRKVKSHITASYPLDIEIMDDPNDFYTGDGTTDIFTDHTFYVYKSDGFCLGPLLGDGSGIRAHFYDVNKMFGVNVQTYNEATDEITNLGKWYWRDHVANPTTELDSSARADGDEQVTVEFRPTCSCELE